MTLNDVMAGAVVFGFLVCGLFFIRYWWRTRDELFLAFAMAFALLGIGQAILALANIPTEERGSIYLIRLAAFLLILIAIFRKNRSSRACISSAKWSMSPAGSAATTSNGPGRVPTPAQTRYNRRLTLAFPQRPHTFSC